MKFSVIIPLYNGAQHIEDTLDSVLAQTYKELEIVLVNDGSPDNVGDVVKNYIAAHPGYEFKYVEQANKGLGGARNTAIKNASGDIISILDQDDLWYPKKLEIVARVFSEHPQVDVVCHNSNVRSGGKITSVHFTGPFEANMHRKMLFGGNRLFTPCTSFKKELIGKIGSFSEDIENLHLVEDYDLWLRMALANCHFHFISDILAEYVKHDNNHSSSAIERMCQSELFVLNSHYNKLARRLPLDWLRMRRRKAQVLSNAAILSVSRGSFAGSVRYGTKMFIMDPLYFLILAGKSLKKTANKIIKKGGI